MRDYFNFRRAMALLTVALVMSLLPTSASAQSWNKRISIHLKSVDISEFFKAINEKSGLEFISSYAEIKHSPKVSVDESDTPVRTILDKVLKPLGFSYQISDGVLSVHDRKPAKDMRLFSGTLRDVEGQPLPGAHVHVVGTKLYTIADGDGNFAIDIPTAETRIEYSFVGMRKKVSIVEAGNSDEYRDVELKYDTDIDEVVVTGYQDFDKNRMAGSVGQISAKDLTLNGFNSVEQALQGKLAGVAVTNVSGMVGRTAKTRVRGTSTMFGSQEPIWVVDGVIQEDPLPFSTQTLDAQGGITESNFDYIRNFVGNSISWLNPMDIDRITVLKDASATAIYGTKAANGVIVINTKRGKVGSLAVSYSGGMQIGQRLSHKAEEMMNSKERVDVSREIFQRGLTASWSNNNIGYAGVLQDYLFGRITAQEFETQVAKLETNNTDWFDLLFRNPVSQNHSVSLSGGSEMARFYASMSYNQTNGTAIGNDQNSYSAHVGLNMDFSKKFRVSVDVSGNRSKTNGFYKFDAYTYAHNVNRAIPAYNEDGTLFYYQNRSLKTGSNSGGYLYNALNERDNTGNQNVNLSFNTSVNAYYDISKDFQFNSLFSVNASSVKGESWATERSNYIADKRGYDYGEVLPTDSKYKLSGLPVGGELNTSNTNQTTWSWRNSLQFDHVYNKVHAVNRHARNGDELHTLQGLQRHALRLPARERKELRATAGHGDEPIQQFSTGQPTLRELRRPDHHRHQDQQHGPLSHAQLRLRQPLRGKHERARRREQPLWTIPQREVQPRVGRRTALERGPREVVPRARHRVGPLSARVVGLPTQHGKQLQPKPHREDTYWRGFQHHRHAHGRLSAHHIQPAIQ